MSISMPQQHTLALKRIQDNCGLLVSRTGPQSTHSYTLFCRSLPLSHLLFFHFVTLCLSVSLQTERDVSVRQRAADLLYAMCDRSNAKQIVAEMLSYLETADYSIREEMVGVRECAKKDFVPCCILSFFLHCVTVFLSKYHVRIGEDGLFSPAAYFVH